MKIVSSIFLSFIVCFSLVCLHPEKGWSQAPHATLIEIGKAVDQGDGNRFMELVDVDSILKQGLDVFFREAKKPEYSKHMPPVLMLVISQALKTGPEGNLLRELLGNEVKAFILNGINSGAFAGKKYAVAEKSGMLAPLLANASTGKKEIRGIGETIIDGEEAIIPFSIHDYGNDNDYLIRGRFGKKETAWQLKGIDNFEQLFSQIRDEALGQME